MVSNNYAQDCEDIQDCCKAGSFLPSMPDCNNGNYYLVFEDNFNGNSLDLSKWQIADPQGALYGNGGLSQEFNTLDNIEVSNGTCKIIARHETVFRRAIDYCPEGCICDDQTDDGTSISEDVDNCILEDGLTNLRQYNYTSSNIRTKQKFFYGKYEILCRLPDGKGFWPAFWTYGGQRWNEIDVFEIYGDNINRFTCNAHHDYDGDGYSETCSYAQDNVSDFTKWHKFTCIFDFDKIIWEIDDNEIRHLHRFSTISNGAPISCGENIANGIYYQEKSYPIEDMHIFMNLAIQSGDDAPDANTVFPNYYEIDYVRFYIKSEQEPCDGCLDHIVYENTNQLPTLTRTDDYIQAGNNVTVQSGQTVSFNAGNSITFLPGFTVEAGSNFNAFIVECNLQNYADVPVIFIGSNAIDHYQIDKCINPVYAIEATGVIFYSFQVYNSLEQLVYTTSGVPISNYIYLWNAISIATGWYSVHLVLLNCSDSDIRDYNLLVMNGNCKMADSSSSDSSCYHNAFSENINYAASDTSLVQNINKEFLLYPNPTNNKLNIFYTLKYKASVTITISDINGNEIFKEININGQSGANRKIINVGQFTNGTYILRITTKKERIENKFIISK